jgi:uncharacterized protein involved in type VI secretion and phage assembly
MTDRRRPFLGKFRGQVTDNADPLGLGRVRAKVPDVLGEHESGWALPSVPFAGKGVGLFLIPPQGANVWIEFEHGDADYPIWTGCFWGVPADGGLSSLAPTDFPANLGPTINQIAAKKVLKTDAGTITLSEEPGLGGVTIETPDGLKIEFNTQGIQITNGQNATIELTGPQVSINGDALEIV